MKTFREQQQMFAHNIASLIGNVGDYPEIRHFESGKVKARFSIAIYAGKDKPAEWFDCEAWGFSAERVAQRVSKGSRVAIAGALKQERWEDAQTGARRSRVVVVAQSVEVIEKAAKSASQSAANDNSSNADYDDIPL